MTARLILCPDDLREAVRWMLQELDASNLLVGLIPAPEQRHCGHCVRVVWSHNPGWYRELCAMFPRRRRRRHYRYTDSTVKRNDVRRVLLGLLGDGSSSQFAEPLLGVAKDVRAGLETRLETAFGDVALIFGPHPTGLGGIEASGF